MKIELHNIKAVVTESTEEERVWLSKFLSFPDYSVFHKSGGKSSAPAKFKLFNKYQSTFPAGLFAIVQRGALKKQFSFESDDKRKAPCQRDLAADLAWLRWYQLESIDTIVEETRGIIHAPTGSGKGEILIGLVKALPCLWIFLVHRQNLVDDIGRLQAEGIVTAEDAARALARLA